MCVGEGVELGETMYYLHNYCITIGSYFIVTVTERAQYYMQA